MDYMIVPTDPCHPLAAEASAVRAEGVNFSYGEGEARFQVLFDNRIDIAPGQLVVMTGPSGSGKTTLLTLIGGLRSLQEGRIEVLGHDLSGLGPRELVRVRRDIGFIFQLHNLFESLTAYENVKMAVQLAGVGSAAHIRERAVGILERLGLGHRIDHKPHSLSGGQRQRGGDRPRPRQSAQAGSRRRADRRARQGCEPHCRPTVQGNDGRARDGDPDGDP